MVFVFLVCVSALLGGNAHAQLSVNEKVRALAESSVQVNPNSSDLELRLMTLNQAIMEAPQNPELQLKKGLYLIELGRTQQATDVFEALRQDYPNHPAPYLNLASIFARQGRLEEARQMLIKSDSLASGRYQTQLSLASVNIGLALAALRKANELHPDPVTEKKIREIEQLVAKLNGSPMSSGNDMGSAPTRVEKLGIREPVAAKPRKIGQYMHGRDMTPRGDRLKLSASVLPDAMASAAAKRNKLMSEASDEARAEIMNTVESWASAWSRRDHHEYMSYYSSRFKAPNGMGREAWGQYKQAVFERAGVINVEVKIKQVKVAEKLAWVQFSQRYRSEVHSDAMRKELRLAMEGGRWRILSEIPL